MKARQDKKDEMERLKIRAERFQLPSSSQLPPKINLPLAVIVRKTREQQEQEMLKQHELLCEEEKKWVAEEAKAWLEKRASTNTYNFYEQHPGFNSRHPPPAPIRAATGAFHQVNKVEQDERFFLARKFHRRFNNPSFHASPPPAAAVAVPAMKIEPEPVPKVKIEPETVPKVKIEPGLYPAPFEVEETPPVQQKRITVEDRINSALEASRDGPDNPPFVPNTITMHKKPRYSNMTWTPEQQQTNPPTAAQWHRSPATTTRFTTKPRFANMTWQAPPPSG